MLGGRGLKRSNRKDVVKIVKPVYVDDEFTEGWYLKYMEDIKSPDYKGLDFNAPSTKSKYSEYNSLKDIFGDEIPKPENQDINEYLNELGFGPGKSRNDRVSMGIEGWCDDKTMAHHSDICIENDVKSVMQIGFNSGISAEKYLLTEGVEEVLSFDIATHLYLPYANLLLEKKYPGRHLLISGDSKSSVPTFHRMFPNKKYDFIFIDGDHNFEGAYADIINCSKIAHEKTILILDDVCPHKGSGIGVYKAMLKSISEGVISFISHHEVSRAYTSYRNGYAICRYGGKSNPIPYLQIESMIPTTYYTGKIENATSKRELNGYIREIKDNNIRTDIFLEKAVKKKMEEFNK